MIIDTHSHIYLDEDFAEDKAEVVERLKQAGVGKVILPNVDASTISQMLELYRSDTSLFFPTMGLHPTEVKEDYKSVLADVIYPNISNDMVAIGEIGIDLYWEQDKLTEQIDAFETQVDWAIAKGLPIIIHQRSALQETLTSLRRFDKSKLRGVFHCFGGTLDEANVILDSGDFVLGIGGVLTYKKSDISKCMSDIPLDRVVVETDAPYLAPTPNRGKRNETAFIVHTVQKMADLTGKTFDEIAEITTRNAERIFEI